jgi:hypothetical protein
MEGTTKVSVHVPKDFSRGAVRQVRAGALHTLSVWGQVLALTPIAV